MSTKVTKQLVNPQSIVVVGASNDTAKPGGAILRNIIEGGFKGQLYVVNPKEEEIQGIKCSKTVNELPQVDLAVIAIAAKYTEETVRVLTEEKGTKAFIIISAGFGEESHEGKELELRIVSLIEKATESIDEDDAMKMMERIQKGVFNYNDFLKQLKWIKRIGSLKGILGMIPGLGSKLKGIEIDDKQLVYVETIIGSMTPEERKNPELLAKSMTRRERISKGSGRSYQEVNALTKRFDDMKKQMQQMSGMSEQDMQRSMRTGQGMPQAKPKKGKGKGRGNFRY